MVHGSEILPVLLCQLAPFYIPLMYILIIAYPLRYIAKRRVIYTQGKPMHNSSSDDLPSDTQKYLDFLIARIQQVTADYLELEKEKRTLLSQPQPSQEQLRSLLLQL